MVREELQGHYRHQGCKSLVGSGNFNHVIRQGLYLGISLGNNRHNLALTGLHFLNVADHFLIGTILGGNENHRHLLVNQSNRSMLHLSSRIALRMDVRNFFQLQSSFQSHREVVAPTQIEHVACILVCRSNLLD